jgi:hypothetical protein
MGLSVSHGAVSAATPQTVARSVEECQSFRDTLSHTFRCVVVALSLVHIVVRSRVPGIQRIHDRFGG